MWHQKLPSRKMLMPKHRNLQSQLSSKDSCPRALLEYEEMKGTFSSLPMYIHLLSPTAPLSEAATLILDCNVHIECVFILMPLFSMLFLKAETAWPSGCSTNDEWYMKHGT